MLIIFIITKFTKKKIVKTKDLIIQLVVSVIMLLTAVLSALKLIGIVKLSWWAVTSPLWGMFFLCLGVLIGTVIYYAYKNIRGK